MNWVKWLGSALGLAVLAGVAATVYGSSRWRNNTAALRARLEAARVTPSPSRYRENELKGLPAPVQRYFRAALKDGRPIITAASVTHTGSIT